MVRILYFIIFLAVVALIIYGIHCWISNLKYSLEMRYLHCRTVSMMFISMVLVFNAFSIPYFIQIIDRIINAEQLSIVWNMILPQRAYKIEYMLLVTIFLNIALALFMGILLSIEKGVLGKNINFLNTDNYNLFGKIRHFPWLFANKVYEEQEGGEVNLTQKGFTMGLWARGIKFVFLIIAAFELLITAIIVLWGTENICDIWLIVMKSWNIIPLAGFLFVEQLQWFMEADINEEAGTFSSENIEENLQGDISVLVDLCRGVFGTSKALLYADKGNGFHITKNGVGSNDLGNRQKEDCIHPDVLEMLWNQIKNSGVKQSDYLQNALVELLNGKSINVRDHIQGEFLIYLVSYLNYYMSQGRTGLVLCSDSKMAKEVCHSLKERMKMLNNIYSVWDIQTIEGAEIDKPMSLLVCSYNEFLDNNIIDKRPDFTDDLFCTVIANGFDLFAQDGVRIERLFTELYRAKRMEQYVILTDEDNDGLRTAMERYLKKEIIPFNNDERKENSGIMIWASDSVYKLQRFLEIGNNRSPHIGTALPIALVAAKYDLPQIYIIPDKQVGNWTFQEAMVMSQQEMMRYLEDSLNIKSIIRYDVDEAMRQKDLSMIITYDNSYNMFNTIWNWMKYVPEGGSLLHVISPTYLLRDYFVDNFDKLILKNNEYDALIPINLGMQQSRMKEMLVELCSNGLTEKELMERAKSAGWKYETVIDLLRACLNVVLTKGEIHNVFECFHFEEEKRFITSENCFSHETRVTLIDENIRARLLSELQYAALIEKGNQKTELEILAENITNYYLRDQLAVFLGHYHRITRITDQLIYAEQCMPSTLPQYYPVSKFVFDESSWEEKDSCVDTEYIDWNLCESKVHRRIYGYWACNSGNELVNPDVTTWNSVCDSDHKPIIIVKEKCHVLEINIRKTGIEEKWEETAVLAACMINGLAKTLFPRTWQNLYAITADGPQEEFFGRLNDETDTICPEEIIRSVIPWAENPRTKSNKFITIYILEFSNVEFGMVQMFYDNREKILSLIKEYLEWYLEAEEVSDKNVENDSVENAEEVSEQTEKNEKEMSEKQEETEGEETKEEKEAEEEIIGDSEEDLRKLLEEAIQINGEASKWNENIDYRRYLKFGLDRTPKIFAPQQLLDVCEKNIVKHEVPNADQNPVSITGNINRCTFCGKPALFTVHLQDGRCMCSNCKDHQIKQKDEIKQLFRDTIRILEKDYGIKLRKNIHVRFQSADTIRRATGVMEGGRVLGFYNRANHQLWIEARGPKICVQGTLIHELSHTWQFDELPLKKLYEKLPGTKEQKDALQLMLLEGHAVYMEIETMRRLHEEEYAKYLHEYTMMRKDEYGNGYRLVADYLKNKEAEGSHMTPYEAMKDLIHAIINGTVEL